jgi:hypothetical protein
MWTYCYVGEEPVNVSYETHYAASEDERISLYSYIEQKIHHDD